MPPSENGDQPPDTTDPIHPAEVEGWEDAFEDVADRFAPGRDTRTLVAAEQGTPPQITKFTPRRVARIFSELQKGRPRSTAAIAAGVTARTFYNWYNRGEAVYQEVVQGTEIEEEDRRYLYFYYGVLQAENEWERKTLDRIEALAEKENRWNALMRLLESRFAERYSKKAQQKDVQGAAPAEGTTVVNISLGDRGGPQRGREIEDPPFEEVTDGDG